MQETRPDPKISYYHELNPQAANQLARRIVEAAARLQELPELGRPGLRSRTRERVVNQTPYVLVYRVTGDVVEILHVWHGAKNWTHQR